MKKFIISYVNTANLRSRYSRKPEAHPKRMGRGDNINPQYLAHRRQIRGTRNNTKGVSPWISISKSTAETKKIASKVALQILQFNIGTSATVLGLQGELGAGKTTFLQGFAKGLGIKEKILSPTFILMRKFPIPHNKINVHSKISNLKFGNFYHIDCYRLNNSKEILDLGFKEIISNPENIVAIEWPEKIKDILSRLQDNQGSPDYIEDSRQSRSSMPTKSSILDRIGTKSGPKNIISIKFKHLKENMREIKCLTLC